MIDTPIIRPESKYLRDGNRVRFTGWVAHFYSEGIATGRVMEVDQGIKGNLYRYEILASLQGGNPIKGFFDVVQFERIDNGRDDKTKLESLPHSEIETEKR